jgi:hypothetical protein
MNIGTTIRKHRLWQGRPAVRAYSTARALANRCGFEIMLKTYYSPLPDLRHLPAETWSDAHPMPGVEFDLDAQAAFLEMNLGEALTEFRPDPSVAPQYRYDEQNPSYPLPDARLLFAMIRRLRPRLIVELGSGQTSRVIAQACRRNAADGHETSYTAFDPYPTAIDQGLPGLTDLMNVAAQAVPEQVFGALRSGDVLFVDTTHTVKLGSEVNRIVLDVLPLLAPGVFVHFHDISLPYEYPRYLIEDYALYWAEQYLLHAFLCMNPGFETLCAVHALCRARPEIARSIGLAAAGETGGAFWIRRKQPELVS